MITTILLINFFNMGVLIKKDKKKANSFGHYDIRERKLNKKYKFVLMESFALLSKILRNTKQKNLSQIIL